MKRKIVLTVAVLALLSGAVFLLFRTGDAERDVSGDVSAEVHERETSRAAKDGRSKRSRKQGVAVETVNPAEVSPSVAVEEGNSSPTSEEEKREAEETALVDSFDALTDKWMEPAKAGVSMKAVEEFSARFRKVPRSRKEECLHRALNLVPDENVMLLAGILFDKSLDKDLIETTFNDILNRDEAVKKPIMEQIFKDKTHPCWADVAWILDVTGCVPKKD